MELRELRVFVTIAQLGSVTRAAEVLHMSSSAVSHALLALEADLDSQLFHRLPRGMTLTEAGAAAIVPAQDALLASDAIRSATDGVIGVLSGRVTLVSIRLYTAPITDLVAEFAAMHPHVLVRLLTPLSHEAGIARLLRDGDCDLGFLRATTVPADLEQAATGHFSPVFVMPADHRLAGRTQVSLHEVSQERIIGPLDTSPSRPVFEDVFRAHGIEPLVVAEAATNEIVLELIRRGVGCTVADEASVALVVGQGAVAARITELPPQVMMIANARNRELSPAARALRELAVARWAAATGSADGRGETVGR